MGASGSALWDQAAAWRTGGGSGVGGGRGAAAPDEPRESAASGGSARRRRPTLYRKSHKVIKREAATADTAAVATSAEARKRMDHMRQYTADDYVRHAVHGAPRMRRLAWAPCMRQLTWGSSHVVPWRSSNGVACMARHLKGGDSQMAMRTA
eukprot:359425-Chlamydomonas_euryale.AAC.5